MVIIYLVLLAILCYSLLTFKNEGDYHTRIGQFQLGHKTVDEILNRVQELFLYQNFSIKWPFQVGISLVIAILIFLLKPPIILTTLMIFLAMDIQQRWNNVHVRAGLLQECSQLLGAVRDRFATSLTPSPPFSVNKSKKQADKRNQNKNYNSIGDNAPES